MSKQLRVCLAAWDYPTASSEAGSGIGSSTYTLAHTLQRLGCCVHVVVRFAWGIPSDFTDDGVFVHTVKVGNLHYYLSRLPLVKRWGSLIQLLMYLEIIWAIDRRIQELAKQEGIDIVELPNVPNPFWRILPSLRKIPLVIWVHGATLLYKQMLGWKVDWVDRLYATLDRQTMRLAKLVNCPSAFLGNYYRSLIGNTVQVLAYPAPLEYFENPGLPKEPTERQMHTVFAASPLGWAKGVDVLMQAIPIVTAQVPNVRFIVAGGNDTYSADALRASMEQQGLADRVEFPGHVPLNRIPACYRECDIFVTATRWDNSPLSVIEAMAAGKPVVGTNIGGVPELVLDGQTGVVVPVGDPIALAQALVRLLGDREMRKQMGNAGRERAFTLYHPLKVAERRLEIYESLLQRQT